MTIYRYVGFNDLTTGNRIGLLKVDENSYGERLNEVIHEELRGYGDFAALLEPITDDPDFKGYSRLTITVGPPQHFHPCSHCGDETEAVDLCEDCSCCMTCCHADLGVGDCNEGA
jgi:hypothetical protein